MSTILLNRREFMISASAGASALVSCGRADVRRAGRPNVLFMVIDDLNDWVGCLGGHPGAVTPNIDRLAGRGVLFTNAHCAAPACGPSRAAVMTGIRPSTSGVYLNSQPFRDSDVLREASTIPQHFMAHGYTAEGSGKILHGIHPDPPSWNEYWPSKITTKPPDPIPQNTPLNGIPGTSHFDWGPVDASPDDMGDSKVAEWVAGRLREERDAPFFLGCGFYKPHLPWYVPKRYFDMHPLESIVLPDVNEDDLDDVPVAGHRMARPEGDHKKVIEYGQWRKAVQGYLACISFVDECVGRVLEALDNSPHRDNTIVVLWSDHGWHLGEKLHWRKFSLWEEATHNVLAVAAPGVTAPGGRCGEPVNLIDLYPTLIDLCGLGPRGGIEGESLMPLLVNPDARRDTPTLTTHGRGNHSLRSKRWRYIRYADGSEELYDHETDGLEWINLAGNPEYLGVIQSLARHLPISDAPDSPVENREAQLKRMEEMGIQLP